MSTEDLAEGFNSLLKETFDKGKESGISDCISKLEKAKEEYDKEYADVDFLCGVEQCIELLKNKEEGK